ncbi:MAG: patatin-like phospholipase family protein [Chloroflexi bacterium]|nr:patatin-like phospholipase family protein [Chloroflexota bacterium]
MAKNIVLALGGGGVKGIAHLGVVACLLDHDYEIHGIAGTSAGGMFGAPLAAKVPPRVIFAQVVPFMKKPDFSRASADGASIAGTHGLENALAPFIQGRLIEDLPIKFVATAASLLTGKEVIIDSGEAIDAVLATIAIPGVFPARGENLLVDGGVLDPVPILPARAINPHLPIVAVALNEKSPDAAPDSEVLAMGDPITERILERLGRTKIGETLDIVTRGLSLGMDKLTELSIETGQPDVIVRPLVGQHFALSMIEPQELFDEGYRAMKEQLNVLEKACSMVNSIKRAAKYNKTD